MKFVPVKQQEEKPVIEVIKENQTVRTKIKYPEQKRTDREYYEYEHDEREDL